MRKRTLLFSSSILLGFLSFNTFANDEGNAKLLSMLNSGSNQGASASESEADQVKDLFKQKFTVIYNYNNNISFTKIPIADLYEVSIGGKKGYTNKNVDYFYLNGQVFVSNNGQIVDMTDDLSKIKPSNDQKSQVQGSSANPSVNPSASASSDASGADSGNSTVDSVAGSYYNPKESQKTYSSTAFDGYEKSLFSSDDINEQKDSAMLKYLSFADTDGSKIPSDAVSYVKGLDLTHAAKVVYGNGKRAVISFEDPDCPFCQNLENNLLLNADQIDTTFYILPWPLSVHPHSKEKIKFLWSQKDVGNAWKSWMIFAKNHPDLVQNNTAWETWIKVSGRKEGATSDAPLKMVDDFTKKYGFRYTPTILFPNGTINEGDVKIDKLKEYLYHYDTKLTGN